MTQHMDAAEFKRQQMLSWSERQFQNEVILHAEYRAWMVYHTLDSRGSQPGFPDLVLTRNGVTLFRELKAEHGQVTPAQDRWLSALDGMVWRPSMWDRIVEELEEMT